MPRKLTPYEQETTISFNRGADDAYVFTYERTWISQLKRLGAAVDYENAHGGKGYVVPKRWVRKPLSPRNERRS